LTDQEGQKLEQIARRGGISSVWHVRAAMLLTSAGGNRGPVIAKRVQPKRTPSGMRSTGSTRSAWPAWTLDGREAVPACLSPDDEDFVVRTADTHPTGLGEPITRWPVRKLAAQLRRRHSRVIRIGHEALRCLSARHALDVPSRQQRASEGQLDRPVAPTCRRSGD